MNDEHPALWIVFFMGIGVALSTCGEGTGIY